ncbi:MAG: epoxyqueuosine reductase QueH [Candidatus Omnitrophota bacterium]|nr:epoxyqueuosine reductase QueH [Candidatus Omnitrophota bacterium]
MKLLLHTCCAPCLIYPLERLREKWFEVTGLFYNPNIHPFTEYQNRKQAVENFIKSNNIEVIYPEYNPAEFFQAVNLKEKNGRCSICWSLRLQITARTAKARGFTHFSTTLLVSPYQDQELLKRIGNEIASTEEIGFYYEDFRPGFKEAHDLAKKQGMYCQNYCGCIYSEIERHSNK